MGVGVRVRVRVGVGVRVRVRVRVRWSDSPGISGIAMTCSRESSTKGVLGSSDDGRSDCARGGCGIVGEVARSSGDSGSVAGSR